MNAHNESVSATDCPNLNGCDCDSPWENFDRFTLMYIYRSPPLSHAYSVRLSGDTYKEGQTNAFLKSVAVHADLELDLVYDINASDKKQGEDCGESKDRRNKT